MGLRVLLLDDDDESRVALRELVELWGHEAVDTRTGVAALGAEGNFHPDVAIIDLALPGGLDGYDVAETMSKRAGN